MFKSNTCVAINLLQKPFCRHICMSIIEFRNHNLRSQLSGKFTFFCDTFYKLLSYEMNTACSLDINIYRKTHLKCQILNISCSSISQLEITTFNGILLAVVGSLHGLRFFIVVSKIKYGFSWNRTPCSLLPDITDYISQPCIRNKKWHAFHKDVVTQVKDYLDWQVLGVGSGGGHREVINLPAPDTGEDTLICQKKCR